MLQQETDWEFVSPRTALLSRAAILRMVVGLAYEIPGHIMEFGVAEGASTRVIRREADKMEKHFDNNGKKQIFACDSFQGLQETYEGLEVGAFACEPPKISGVEIVEGFFEESLTDALAQRVGKVAFASLDADLYSSTTTVLDWLTPLLQSGSLLLFDEFLGEDEAEKRAFEDWQERTGLRTLQIGYFVREPSGNGTVMDARALYQVVGDAPLHRLKAKPGLARNIADRLRGNPQLYHQARRIFRTVTGGKY